MGKKFPPEIKAIALQELARGELRQDVAKKYGCSTAALRSWEQEKKAGESDGFLAAGDGPSPPTGGEPEEGQAASEIPPSLIEPVIDGRKVDQSTQTWLFATNHLNMLYMLSMGVLTGPAGFRGKHYADPSGDVPGWIPLFRGEVPVAVLERCTSEDPKTLHACMAEIDVTLLTGTIQLITREGEVVSTELPSDATASGAMMLVPAPLPSTLVKGLRPDHHRFTAGELDEARRCADEARAELILTTEKDAVRLPPGVAAEPRLAVVRIEAEILAGEAALRAVLDAALAAGDRRRTRRTP